ncbi:Oidioi.mRNA.OKI2018_I69.PAR.g10007.t1.cds [Oikopleura dioica]|uniref:Oidioi.mRNA.OKI2018_I69.PAR.g10007.t1.cds n=1 Tax=Oikopleura dioica TaxID=34765 RepID=A0ABN7RSS2_OIKDI|nr:Oidioi.mRNA.OKI2018_I69.PAR.g10007.t1.cds [Oikopleura dioica]
MAHENRLDLSYKIAILFWYLASGAEMVCYQPILPEFLDKLRISQAHLGTLVSMFGLASMIASPIFGKIADKMGQSRLPVLIANLFSISGHLTILLKRDLFWLCVAKIFIGIGMSCDGCILGQVGRQVAKSSRSSLPSLVMLQIWTGVFACNFIYYTKQKIIKIEEIEENSGTLITSQASLLERNFKSLKDNLLHELVIVGILGSVSAATTVVTMEAVIGPITTRYLDWTANDLAALHILCGTSSISGYALIKPLSRWANQPRLMANAALSISINPTLNKFSTFFLDISVLVLASILSVSTSNQSIVTFLFMIGAVIFSFYIPHLYALGASLVSRNCHPDNQAAIQGNGSSLNHFIIPKKGVESHEKGIRIGLGNTMLAIGPLWAGHTLPLAMYSNLFLVIFVWVILFLGIFLVFLFFSREILKIDCKST